MTVPRGKSAGPIERGLVVGTHGRRHRVELAGHEVLDCVTRGKRNALACGDHVHIARSGPGEGVVEQVAPRSSLLYRSDQYRQKLIAANVTQIVVVLAAVPSFYEELLNRCLVAADSQGLSALIVLNKFDLEAESARALERLQLYAALGYRVLPMSAKQDISPLRPLLKGQVSVLVGQSGMGKSTIINTLIPGMDAETAEVSTAMDSGRHTTTHARLYHLDEESRLIDSPGMQEFGLHHLTEQEIAAALPEFRPLLGTCRFHNCRHLVEPGCAIGTAAQAGGIDARRLESYRKLAREIEAGKPY
jgi:ribosome biogenesis GTPase